MTKPKKKEKEIKKEDWFAGNYEYTDNKGVSWNSPQERFVIGLCGICGCGLDQIKYDIIQVFIDIAEDRQIKDTKYNELILNVLTHADLLEHGTGIHGSWLTDKGKAEYKKL